MTLISLAYSESLKELARCHRSRVTIGVQHHLHQMKQKRRENFIYRVLALCGEEVLKLTGGTARMTLAEMFNVYLTVSESEGIWLHPADREAMNPAGISGGNAL